MPEFMINWLDNNGKVYTTTLIEAVDMAAAQWEATRIIRRNAKTVDRRSINIGLWGAGFYVTEYTDG